MLLVKIFDKNADFKFAYVIWNSESKRVKYFLEFHPKLQTYF